MTTITPSIRRSQAGYSMAEILVATAIFAVIIVAALAVYDQSNKVFKKSLESADVQQNTRVAFNRLVSDLRMAGFDYDRDGIPAGATVETRENDRTYSTGTIIDVGGKLHRASVGGMTADTEPSFSTTVGGTTTDNEVTWVHIEGANQYQQPDEQIEYAGRTAITLRGNLDYETDSGNDQGRETAFEPTGGQFPVVTTANDEIVTYALVSTNSAANEDSITFYADIAKPRNVYPGGSAETLVTIDGIDTDLDADGMPANPPYTLYRITLKDNGDLNRVPVADNIRSVRFTYFEDQSSQVTLKDLAGDEIPTAGVAADTGIIGGDGQYDPNAQAVIAQREIRKKIRSVRVELTGMAPYPDRDYTNPDETNVAIQGHRTYTLATTIVPRNLGKHGIREQSTDEPGPPKITRVCRAGCGVLYVQWEAPKVTAQAGAAEQYQVEIGEMVGTEISWTTPVPVGAALETAIPDLDPTKTLYVQVKAINTYGSSPSENSLSLQPVNMTKPLPPANVTASSDQIGRITVGWDSVAANVSGVNQTCTTGTLSGDLLRHQKETVYRVTRNTVNTATGATELWTGEANAGPYTGGAPTYDAATDRFTFVDDTVPNCTTYYYFVEAFDKLCRTNAATNSPADLDLSRSGTSTSAQGAAISGGFAPADVSNLVVDEASTCTGTNCNVTLNWPRVTTDSAGNSIKISSYAIRTVTRKASDHSEVSDDAASPTIVTVSDLAQETITWTSGKTKVTASGAEVYFVFQVAAQQCDNPGPALRSEWAPVPGRKFPCTWDTANLPTITVSGTEYEGDGLTADSAWVVTDPTSINVATASALSEVKATFRVISPVPQTHASETKTNASSFSFAFPVNPTDGQAWQIDLEMTDSGTCKRFETRYVFDSPTSCCLLPTFYDSDLISGTSRTVTVKLANVCDETLTLQTSGLKINWNTAYVNGNKLESIKWPGLSAATTVNNSSGSLTLSPPSGATTSIGANTSSYELTMTFSKNINTSVVTGLCATYRLGSALSNSSCKVVTSSTSNMTTCD